MVLEHQAAGGAPRSHLIRAIAPQVSTGEETLRLWCNRHGQEVGPTPVAESLQEQNERLKRGLAEARRTNEIEPSWVLWRFLVLGTRMVRALRAVLGVTQGTVKRVATQLGYGVESVRAWSRGRRSV